MAHVSLHAALRHNEFKEASICSGQLQKCGGDERGHKYTGIKPQWGLLLQNSGNGGWRVAHEPEQVLCRRTRIRCSCEGAKGFVEGRWFEGARDKLHDKLSAINCDALLQRCKQGHERRVGGEHAYRSRECSEAAAVSQRGPVVQIR